MTPEFRASAVVGRQAPHWNDASRKALAEDIRQQISEATNEEVQRRRKFEADADTIEVTVSLFTLAAVAIVVIGAGIIVGATMLYAWRGL